MASVERSFKFSGLAVKGSSFDKRKKKPAKQLPQRFGFDVGDSYGSPFRGAVAATHPRSKTKRRKSAFPRGIFQQLGLGSAF